MSNFYLCIGHCSRNKLFQQKEKKRGKKGKKQNLFWNSFAFSIVRFFISFIFNSEKNRLRQFCRNYRYVYEKKLLRGQGKFQGSWVGKAFDSDPSCLRQNALKIATLFKTLNSEIECFFKIEDSKNLYQEPIWAPAYTMKSGTYNYTESSSETHGQGQLVGSIKCSWSKFTVILQ